MHVESLHTLLQKENVKDWVVHWAKVPSHKAVKPKANGEVIKLTSYMIVSKKNINIFRHSIP